MICREKHMWTLRTESETFVLTIARAAVGELYRRREKKEELQTCCKDVLALLTFKIMCFNCHLWEIPLVCLRMLTRRFGSLFAVVAAAARCCGQNMSSACHESSLTGPVSSTARPGGCRVHMIQAQCWASDSWRTTQIPSWSCNHRPAAHSLRDTTWIMRA